MKARDECNKPPLLLSHSRGSRRSADFQNWPG
jgi:hypothetical protein